MFNICCDNKIPFAKEAFYHVGNVTYRKGNRLTSEDLKGVDLLFIRSGTKVDSSLLEGTPVKFVASATAGTDHIDKPYLDEVNIPFFHAPGCNATSVVEYIIASLYTLADTKEVELKGRTVGIIGAGNVGGRLASRLEALGFHVLVCDPPLLEKDPTVREKHTFVSLDQLVSASDIVTLHVPLVHGGIHPTFHLFDEPTLKKLKKDVWLLNASRGAVIDNQALLRRIEQDGFGAVVLDVWEGEPTIYLELLDRVDLGTAHIAGYSYEGKVNGTIMVYQACVNHFGIDPAWDFETILAPSDQDQLDLSYPEDIDDEQTVLRHLVKQMYDIEADDHRLRASLEGLQVSPTDHFLTLRKEYPRRRSFERFRLQKPATMDPDRVRLLTDGLGIQVY